MKKYISYDKNGMFGEISICKSNCEPRTLARYLALNILISKKAMFKSFKIVIFNIL